MPPDISIEKRDFESGHDWPKILHAIEHMDENVDLRIGFAGADEKKTFENGYAAYGFGMVTPVDIGRLRRRSPCGD